MAGPWEEYAGATGTPLKVRQAEAGIASSEASAKRTEGLTPAEIRKAELDAKLAEYKLQEAEDEARKRAEGEQKTGNDLRIASKELANVIAAAAAAKQLSREGLFATGFGSETARNLSNATPAGAVAGYIDTIGASTAFERLQKMRDESPTGGALGNVTEKELDLLKSAIANIDPTKSDADFQRSMDVIMDRYMDVYGKLGGDPAIIGQQFKLRTGAELPKGLVPMPPTAERKEPAAEKGAAPATEMRVGAGDKYVTEEAKLVASRLQQAFDAGASREELQALAGDLGVQLPADRVEAAIQYRDAGGKGAQVAPAETERPLSSQLIGAAADTPVGAYAIGAGSALTGGMVDELAGLIGGEGAQERARFARDYSQTESPIASLLGEFTGSALASIPAVRGAQAALPALSGTRAALAGEGLLGAITGAGEADEGSRLGGAALGGTLGLAGGAVPGAIARVASPRTPEAVRTLREAGVRDMSLGQVLGAPGAEASLARTMPGGGDVALSAQRKAFEQFQDAYVNDALSNIGAQLPKNLKPTKRIAEAQKAFDNTYEQARSQMQVVPDADMRNELSQFIGRLRGDEFAEENAARLEKLVRDQLQRRIQGPISGDEYKSLSSLLGKRRAAFAKQGNAELADGVAELQRIVDNNARRHSPAEAVDLMDRADRGYAILTRAEEAARNLGNMPGEFTPQQALAASRKGDISQRNRAYSRGEARGQQLAEAGVEGLGKAPPVEVSGIERGIGVTGSVLGAPLSAPTNLALGIGNAPGIRQVLNTAIAGQRPQVVTRVADLIRARPEYLAALGGGTALGLIGDATGLRNQPADVQSLRTKYGYDPEDLNSISFYPN